MGVTGLSDRFQRSVDAVNVLAVRVCLVARKMFDLGRPWIIENPPTRSDSTGAFRRFFRLQLAGHASFFTLPCVQELIEYTGAMFAHVPMCFFGMPEQKYLTFMYPPYMHAAIQCMESVRCIHSKHSSVAGGFDADGSPWVPTPAFIRVGVRSCLFAHASSRRYLACLGRCSLRRCSHRRTPVTHSGMPADRIGVPADAVTRGKQGKQSNMTSRGAHERFHRPSETLRNLHYCTRDIPVSWTKMLDVEQSCDACLRAKAAHQHHSGSLPETTAPGEICSFDLWKTQTASVLGGERDVFGVIDMFSDFSDVTRIKSKTDVPDCIAQFIAFAASVGVVIRRMHTDNEAIFHTTQARDATKARFRAQGVLITTGSEYASRQNSKIERLWRTLAGDGRASLLAAPELDDSYYVFAVIDANAKRNVLPFSDDRSSCPAHAFTGKYPSAAVFRVFGALTYVTLDHELNQSAKRLQKAGERASPGIMLTYGRDGTVFDRRRPGWVVHVPEYHLPKPIITPHVTVLEHIRPSPALLRRLTFTAPHEVDRTPVSLRVSADGDVEQAEPHSATAGDADGDGLATPPPSAGSGLGQQTLPNPTPVTIAHRMSRATTGPHGRQSDDGVAQQIALPPHAAAIAPPHAAPPAVVPPPAPIIQPTGHVSSRLRSSGTPCPCSRHGTSTKCYCSQTLHSTRRAPSTSTTLWWTAAGCRTRCASSRRRPPITTSTVEQNLFVGAVDEDVLYSFSTADADVKVRAR